MIVRELQPFGVELSDVQIPNLDSELRSRVLRLIWAHRVVVFRDQTTDDEGFVRFLSALGPLMFTPGETPVPNAPDLNIVSNVGRTKPPRSVFHTDTSYVDQPPAFGAMRAVTLPHVGGETLFSNQVQAAADLAHNVAEWLSGRTLLHQTSSRDGSLSQARHPVLQRNPITGDITLFLTTAERCSQLSDIDPALSQRIIALLYHRSIKSTRLYRHVWRRGDIVMWDNRATMHRADHTGVIGDRVLHRGLVRGGIPDGI